MRALCFVRAVVCQCAIAEVAEYENDCASGSAAVWRATCVQRLNEPPSGIVLPLRDQKDWVDLRARFEKPVGLCAVGLCDSVNFSKVPNIKIV